MDETTPNTPDTAVMVPLAKQPKEQQRNIRIKVMPGQAMLIEDVLSYEVAATGITFIQRETVTKKVGAEMVTSSTIKQVWFNPSVVITFGEEFVDA